MWPSSYLLVLVVVLGLTHCRAFQCSTSPSYNEIPEYVVCPVDNWTEKPQNDVTHANVCDFISILPLIHCDASDHTIVAPLCWRLHDLSSGTMQVTFSLLPQKCNFTGYDITLMVHEDTNCPNSGVEFLKHSKKEIAIKDCTNSSCMDHCSRTGSLVFYHMFSACYQLYLTPRRHYQAFQDLVSTPIAIETLYVKTPISTVMKPMLHLDWNHDSLSMQAQFPISPASSHISFSHGINSSMGPLACRDTGILLATCATCLGSPEIQCRSTSSDLVVPSCSYQGESVVKCKFAGLKPGNYCVRIQFDDDRCVADTVWYDYSNYSICTWEVFEQYLPSFEVIDDHTPDSPVDPLLLTLLILAGIATCGFTGFVVYRHMLPNSQFPPAYHKPLQIAEQPIVLLLYARDCPPFMQAVAQLRTLMRRVYNCQVMDCWEDSQYASVAQGPIRWLLSLLTNPRVRTVLVISPASVLQETSLVHSTPVQYRQPRAFDCVFSHALRSLHETAGQDSYKRVFIVRLDSGVEEVMPKIKTYLNPLTTYVLPVHLNKLMATLLNLDSIMCTVTVDGQPQPDVASLTDAISDYQQYLRQKPRYIETMLVTETAPTVQQVLA